MQADGQTYITTGREAPPEDLRRLQRALEEEKARIAANAAAREFAELVADKLGKEGTEGIGWPD